MKLICISDTHGRHREVELEAADMIVHAGDMSELGTKEQIQDFIEWFSSLNYQYKILVAVIMISFLNKRLRERSKG